MSKPPTEMTAAWWAARRANALAAGRRGLQGMAAQKLRDYLTAQGWTPDELAAEIDRGSDWVLQALATMPAPQAHWARFAYGRVAATLTAEDFWEICKHDALHQGGLHDHMLRALTAERWPRTLAAFRRAQAWLARGNTAGGGPAPG